MQPVERAIAERRPAAKRGPVGSAEPAPTAHHVESEIGRGYGPMSLKSELASMKARLVVESGDWALMKGQGTFDNIDELFALGVASVPLGDRRARRGGARAARTAAKTRARTPTRGDRADHGGAARRA